MHGLAEIRDQQNSIESLLVGEITKSLIRIAEYQRQLRIVVIGGARDFELQIPMKIEVSLQIANAVEKLGEANTLVYIVASLHELRLYGAPNGDFEVRVNEF